LIAVADAYVPVIKFQIFSVQIDLLMSTVYRENITDDFNIFDDSLLINIDSESQRGLIGPRVAQEIFQLVPNVENFRNTLRCVKLIAQRRGIYGAATGFLGGVSYAILVAMICQWYPAALPNLLLSRFFTVYDKWKWGYRQPITITSTEATIASTALGFSVWNPQQNMRDRSVLMPIITPAYPPTNTTFSVTPTTFSIIKSEFERASEIASNALFGKTSFSDLFEETDFFARYQNYLEIEVCADNDHDFRIWYIII
jgi:poly(A) polymerase